MLNATDEGNDGQCKIRVDDALPILVDVLIVAQ